MCNLLWFLSSCKYSCKIFYCIILSLIYSYGYIYNLPPKECASFCVSNYSTMDIWVLFFYSQEWYFWGACACVYVYMFRFFWSMGQSEKHVFKSFAHINLLSTSSWYLQMIQDKGWIYFLEMGLSNCPVQLVDYYVDKSQHPCQKQDSTKVYTTLRSLHVILPIHVFFFVSVVVLFVAMASFEFWNQQVLTLHIFSSFTSLCWLLCPLAFLNKLPVSVNNIPRILTRILRKL